MEFDWRTYQEYFGAVSRSLSDVVESESETPLMVLEDRSVVINAYHDQIDLQEWSGESLNVLQSNPYSHQKVVISQKSMDRWIQESLGEINWQRQTQLFRERAGLKIKEAQMASHFLLGAMETWWKQVFPKEFKLLLWIEGDGAPKSVILGFQEGLLIGCEKPGYRGLGADEKREFQTCLAWVKSECRIYVQGLKTSKKVWSELQNATDPWLQVYRYTANQEIEWFPRRMGQSIALWLRAYLAI